MTTAEAITSLEEGLAHHKALLEKAETEELKKLLIDDVERWQSMLDLFRKRKAETG